MTGIADGPWAYGMGLWRLAHGAACQAVGEALADLVDDISAPVGRTGNALCVVACTERSSMSIKAVEILLQKGVNVNW
jgi:hypothetical protein